MKRCPNCMDYIENECTTCPFCGYNTDMKPVSKNHLAPGTTLYGKKYTLGKVLGQGGFGITYNAWDEHNYRHVAIKEFFPNSISFRNTDDNSVTCYNEKSSSFLDGGKKKLLQEGATLSHFSDNENIVNVYSFFEENNTAYIVMEYLDGINLKEYLSQNGEKLAPEKAIEIIFSVLNALEDMHSVDLIHRDVSPDNIYICSDGTVKLLDFGSARLAVTDLNKSLSIFVKPGYAPKEQYATHGNQGPWTDIYAVCATLYRMITGEVPTESLTREFEPLKGFSRFGISPKYVPLEKIILKGMELDVNPRTKNVNLLYDQLYSFLYGEPTKIKKLSDSVRSIFHRHEVCEPEEPVNTSADNELPVTEINESETKDDELTVTEIGNTKNTSAGINPVDYSIGIIDSPEKETISDKQSDTTETDAVTSADTKNDSSDSEETEKIKSDKKTLKSRIAKFLEYLFIEYKVEDAVTKLDEPAVTPVKDTDAPEKETNQEKKKTKKDKKNLRTIILQMRLKIFSFIYKLFINKSDKSTTDITDNPDELNKPIIVVTVSLCLIAIILTIVVGFLLS